MTWNYVKDKILVFGEDDYVFADMFISIMGEFNYKTHQDLRINIYLMLQELMNEKLIDVFLLENITDGSKRIVDTIPYRYETKGDIASFIQTIDKEWGLLNYEFPDPDKLFWITTNEKGKSLIQSEMGNTSD